MSLIEKKAKKLILLLLETFLFNILLESRFRGWNFKLKFSCQNKLLKVSFGRIVGKK